eukprot:jgi/Botrbrau1/12887/Bobra.0299s0007.1
MLCANGNGETAKRPFGFCTQRCEGDMIEKLQTIEGVRKDNSTYDDNHDNSSSSSSSSSNNNNDNENDNDNDEEDDDHDDANAAAGNDDNNANDNNNNNNKYRRCLPNTRQQRPIAPCNPRCMAIQWKSTSPKREEDPRSGRIAR